MRTRPMGNQAIWQPARKVFCHTHIYVRTRYDGTKLSICSTNVYPYTREKMYMDCNILFIMDNFVLFMFEHIAVFR